MAVRSAYVERMWGALKEEDVVTKIQWSVLPSGSISRFTTAVNGTVHSVQLSLRALYPKACEKAWERLAGEGIGAAASLSWLPASVAASTPFCRCAGASAGRGS